LEEDSKQSFLFIKVSCKKRLSKIKEALLLQLEQKADVTELLRSVEQCLNILEQCVTNYGDLDGINIKLIEDLNDEIINYEKKIEQLHKKGNLVRFITQSRLRSKLDQSSNNICVQAESLLKYIKEFKIKQLVNEELDEFNSLLEEIEKQKLEERILSDWKNKDVLRRSFDNQKKIKDVEIKSKFDSVVSIVKDTEKKILLDGIVNLDVKPVTSDKDCIVIISKKDDESEQSYSDFVCAQSISTYPTILQTGKREGDPICDQFGFAHFENRTIVVICDGCSWGEESREAARKASKMFLAYVKRKQEPVRNTHDVAEILLRAYQFSHKSIIQGRNEETLFLAGTTTMLGGVLLELAVPENGKKFVFVCASIGDCKAFCYSPTTGHVNEITIGNRGGLDARDPGGRIGPTLKGGGPDLRNLILYSFLCNEGDIIFIVSDGVHDNLDPRQLGKLPSDLGIQGANWDSLKDNISDSQKQIILKWTEDYLDKLFNKPVTVTTINRALIQNSLEVTKPMRDFMEGNPGKRAPFDYVKYPGKLDHTTSLSFYVGMKKPRTSSSSVTYRSEVKKNDEETDLYTSVWDNLFGNEIYVLQWREFVDGLKIPLDEQSKAQLKIILDNSNTGSVTRFKFSEFLKGFGPLDCCVKNVNRVFSAGWFFGFVSVDESKKFLELSPIGTFLIRFSGSKPGSFVLDYVQKSGSVRSVRLNSHPSGGFSAMSEGTNELIFKSLHEIVDIYKSKGVLLQPFSSTLPNQPWFFGDVTSEEATQLLQGKETGTFLIRFSSHPGCFAASFVSADGSVRRGLITKHVGGFQVENFGPVYKSLEEIVEFYIDSKIFSVPLYI